MKETTVFKSYIIWKGFIFEIYDYDGNPILNFKYLGDGKITRHKQDLGRKLTCRNCPIKLLSILNVNLKILLSRSARNEGS